MATKATLSGDTYMFSKILKEKGWKWNPDDKVWTKTGEWTDSDHVIRTVRGYGGIRNRGTLSATIEET